MKKYNVLFCCGDTSADTYLSLLLKELNQKFKEIKKIVVGGEKSKLFSDEFLVNLVSYDAHGFFSPFTQFFKFLKLFSYLKNFIKNNKIHLVVLMDFYGFNIHVAKIAKKYGIKVIYYITPQVWASRAYRIKKIKKYVDCVINIYPFEEKIFSSYGINSFYFGHPITDVLDNLVLSEKDKHLIGLFPGSRKQVIKWNLPVMLKICCRYLQKYSSDVKFIIFGFKKYETLYNSIINKLVPYELKKYIQLSFSQDGRNKIYLSISVSGTVVLENIFYNTPTIVVYNLPLLMYLLIKKMVYIKYISLPNIILDKEVIPEFIKERINVEKICSCINNLINNDTYYQSILNNYAVIKQMLSEHKNVTSRVAQKIVQILYEQN